MSKVFDLYIMRYMLRPPSTPIPGLSEDTDELFKKAVEEVIQYDRASPSLLQRRLSIGYARAARLMEQLEAAGVVGPAEGTKARGVLISSVDEILETSIKGEKRSQEEDPFQMPENYKVPRGLKLSRVDRTPWGKQFSDVLETKDFRNLKTEFPIPIGINDEGKLYAESLLEAGNLIVAGNPLSQKGNFVDNVLLTCLLRYAPDSLRLVLNDQTHYLDLYNGIPHLLSPVINDFDKEVAALRWSLAEKDRRLKLFAQAGVRNITSFNELSGSEALPRILVVTFLVSPNVENIDSLLMLTGMGVRTGIHNIVVVDQTNGKVLPNGIKSNIPARVVFRLSSAGESKGIDVTGAEKLEPGEIIYKPNYGATVKLNAIFTPEVNVKEVVEAVRNSVSSS